jgi:hypothetical protein
MLPLSVRQSWFDRKCRRKGRYSRADSLPEAPCAYPHSLYQAIRGCAKELHPDSAIPNRCSQSEEINSVEYYVRKRGGRRDGKHPGPLLSDSSSTTHCALGGVFCS